MASIKSNYQHWVEKNSLHQSHMIEVVYLELMILRISYYSDNIYLKLNHNIKTNCHFTNTLHALQMHISYFSL